MQEHTAGTTLDASAFYCPFFDALERLECRYRNALKPNKDGMQYNKEGQAMKTYNLTRHVATIMAVFAAIFLLAGCAI